MAVSWTPEQIESLRAAIARGALQVRVGDEQVTYRSLAEMRSILAEMEAATGTSGPRHIYPRFVRRPE